MSMTARLSAVTIAALILFALILRVILTLPDNDNSVLLAVWNLARFFTILTNTLVMVTLGLIAFGTRPGALWRGAVTLAIALVGVVYHFLLAHLVDFLGWARAG